MEPSAVADNELKHVKKLQIAKDEIAQKDFEDCVIF